MKIIRSLSMMMMACLFSCRWGGYEQEIAVIESQKKALGCPQFETQFWDALDAYIVSEKRIPEVSIFKDQITVFEKQGDISIQTKETWLKLEQILFEEAPQREAIDTPARLRMFFAAMEVGDESTEVRKEYKTKIFSQLKKLKDSVPEKSCY